MPEIANKYVCIVCDYKCSRKNDLTKHFLTLKHKRASMEITQENKQTEFKCNTCDKLFNTNSGLWKHKKKCEKLAKTNNEIQTEKTNNVIDANLVLHLLKENSEFKQLLFEQQKQNQEQQKYHQEQLMQVQTENNQLQKQLLDVVKDGKLGNINNTTNNNITNNNQRFNLNFFLNEQCKDAMNIEDFINSLQLELEDLTETKRLGFVQGISRIFTNKLQELDIYSRPLHCTDIKRETVYIKDDNQWEKDNHNKDKLKSIVNKVANKNYRQLSKWQEKHPNYLTMDTQDCDDFMDISCKALGGKNSNEDDKFKQRIMKNVLKEVTLDKI